MEWSRTIFVTLAARRFISSPPTICSRGGAQAHFIWYPKCHNVWWIICSRGAQAHFIWYLKCHNVWWIMKCSIPSVAGTAPYIRHLHHRHSQAEHRFVYLQQQVLPISDINISVLCQSTSEYYYYYYYNFIRTQSTKVYNNTSMV